MIATAKQCTCLSCISVLPILQAAKRLCLAYCSTVFHLLRVLFQVTDTPSQMLHHVCTAVPHQAKSGAPHQFDLYIALQNRNTLLKVLEEFCTVLQRVPANLFAEFR